MGTYRIDQLLVFFVAVVVVGGGFCCCCFTRCVSLAHRRMLTCA